MKNTLICVLLFVTCNSWGWPQNYGPFNPEKVPATYPLEVCTDISNQRPNGDYPLRYEFANTNHPSTRVMVTSMTNGGFCISLHTKGGIALMRPFETEGSALGAVQVYCGLLNEDRMPDYVIITWNGGCGLAFEIYFVTFLLSHSDRYTVHTLLCFDPEPTDFFDIDGSGHPVFLHSMFVYGEEGKDKKAHNYWVFNLLKFSGANVVSANAMVAGFPKWVWYTFKPNHTDTDQLTAGQRAHIWQRAWEEESNTWHRSMFPNPAMFAEEQGKPTPPSSGRAGARR
ncbi:MAG: hypothetical protein WCR06_01055 [bacterium]